jgi:hypothetical protein
MDEDEAYLILRQAMALTDEGITAKDPLDTDAALIRQAVQVAGHRLNQWELQEYFT